MHDRIYFEQYSAHIGHIIIDNIAKRNALTASMWAALERCLIQAAASPELRVLVIEGAGQHFASGADISEFSTLYATLETATQSSQLITSALNALADFPKPTVAKIRGACIGGGCAIALACDIRLADSSAKFAITPAKLGLVYPYDDVGRLIEAVGRSAAKDMLLSARALNAAEAKEIGLINQLLDEGRLDEEVSDYAKKISHLSGASTEKMKYMFRAYESGLRVDSEEMQDLFYNAFISEDFKEGYQAFLDKRKPKF